MKIFSLRLVVLLGCVLTIAPSVKADTLTLPTLSQSDFDSLAKEFSANFSLHDVMPASSMGSIFGFEIGLAAGVTSSEKLEALAKQADASSDISYLPHAGLLGAVTIPFGLTVEGTLVPSLKSNGAEYSQYALALKWTLTDSILSGLPLNIAARGFMSKSDFSFTQTVSGETAKIDYDSTVTGVQVLVSPSFIPMLEPYAGLGYLMGNGEMSTSSPSGTATIFNFTSSTTATSKPNSSQLILGLNFRALLLVFGLEYSRAYDADSYTGKFSLRF